jgi:stearoyl-CoA desaturase (Delta-9 desaturase)
MSADKTTSVDSGTSHKMKINWGNVILLAYFHIASFYSFSYPKLWSTHIIGVMFYMFGGLGGSMGAHRYYTHKAFKANLKLRVLLIFLQTISGQESAINWSRLHRIHHKFVDTDADPHNSKRGFFYSHIGWIMIERHPDVIAAGKKIDMSDLTNDPLLSFQNK